MCWDWRHTPRGQGHICQPCGQCWCRTPLIENQSRSSRRSGRSSSARPILILFSLTLSFQKILFLWTVGVNNVKAISLSYFFLCLSVHFSWSMRASIATGHWHNNVNNFAMFKYWDRCLPQRKNHTKPRCTLIADGVSRVMVPGHTQTWLSNLPPIYLTTR